MRQRRQGLQVSTFPFLAVLLCAMGSLILLLLVIDRRAKVVARAKAMRAMQQALDKVAAEAEKAAAAHQLEWERRRQMLHAQLLQQDRQVLSELHTIQGQVESAAANTQADLARSRQLHEQLQVERVGLTQIEAELNTQRKEAANTAQEAAASQADLARLTAELERMERTLADLHVARQRQQQMYSLVPYAGRRGDNRKPLYIECTGDELIIHPDRLALHGGTLTPAGIRDEIEGRLALQRPAGSTEKPEKNAYLLMLIRPNGISSYYRVLAALRGLPVDFGYEFIDQDWILDFSEDSDTRKKQPWMVVDRVKEEQPSTPSVKRAQAPAPSLTGRPQRSYQGILSGGAVPGRSGSGFAPGFAEPAHPPVGSVGVGAGRELDSAARATGDMMAGGQPSVASSGMGKGILGTGDGNGASFPEPDAAIRMRPALSGASGATAEVAVSGNRSSGTGADARDSGSVTARRPSPGQGEPPFAPGGGAERPDAGPSLAAGQAATPGPPSDSRMAQGAGTKGAQRVGPPGNVGNPGIEAPPSPMPALVPNRAGAQVPPGVDAAQTPTGDGVNRGGTSSGQPGSGEPGRLPASDPLDRLAIPNPPNRAVRATPLRPGLFTGNRDWIISIECTADALVLYPSGQRIAPAEPGRPESGNNPLLEAVQRLIARRQATVRPGEPPYRPIIRFRVRPDGLRCYYLAYPALEALHLPMTRENMDPEEEKEASRGR
jgi:hypothetical protein